jgi:hypothetical protein
MLETITATEVGLEATIQLSSILENPETTFTITLHETGYAATTGVTATKHVTTQRTTVSKEDGKTKVPGGPGALLMAVTQGCIFELRTEPKILSVSQEEQPDGKVKVTINALITAKALEDRPFDAWERERFRVIEFSGSPVDIGSDSSVTMIATALPNNNIAMEIAYVIE